MFPSSDILVAREIESELRDRVGVEAIETSTLGGPHRKPTNMAQRIESLQFYDECPDELAPRQDRESSDLKDAVIAGIIKKSFLKPLEGNDKNATRLGHQNEPKYIKQFYQDSQQGLVPNVRLLDVYACGLAMKLGKPYVRSSADAIAIGEKTWEEMSSEETDMKSHPVECKCRSELGYDGSLETAKRIARQIAAANGLASQGRFAMGDSVYCLLCNQLQRSSDGKVYPR